jgi:hypothetical protein
MPDQSSKSQRGPSTRAVHDGAIRGADQDARLAAELRRNLLRRKQQQRARTDGASAGGDSGGMGADEDNNGGSDQS